MRDLCGEVCELCVSYLARTGLKAERSDICVRNADCEAAYAMRDGFAPILPLFSHFWFIQPLQKGNRICFFLSEGFYRDAASHIIKEAVPPPDDDISDKLSYARARMRMLERKHGENFPPDARMALWRSLTAHTAELSATAREKRLGEAAELALSIGRGIPLRERQSYMEGCGLAAGCILRLLYF